jgi:hypothetical protein
VLACVGYQHPLAREQNAVIDCFGFVDPRRVEILTTALPGSAFRLAGRMLGSDERVPRCIVVAGFRLRFDDPHAPAARRRLEVKRDVPVVAIAGDGRGARIELPDIRHPGAFLEGARFHPGRVAVDQHARASLGIVARHDPANGSDTFGHVLRLLL